MNGPSEIVTWSLTTLKAPPPWPDSTRTRPACAVRLAATQTLAIAGLATTRATAVPMRPLAPLAIWPEKFFSRVDRRGARSAASWVAAWFTSACTSSWSVITVVILALSACWTGGWSISGATVATYRSVLETWLPAQTPMTASGASTQPTTISTAETQACQRPCLDPATGAPPAPAPSPSSWCARR
jgi:hypothetical protein